MFTFLRSARQTVTLRIVWQELYYMGKECVIVRALVRSVGKEKEGSELRV